MESSKLNIRNQEIAHLHQAIDPASDGVLLIDQEGVVIYVNEVFREDYGLSPEAFIGRDAIEVIESEIAPLFHNPEGFITKIEAIYRKGRDAGGLEWAMRGEKIRWIAYSSEIVRHGPLKGSRIDLFRNLSRTKDVEAALHISRQLNEALTATHGLPGCRTTPNLAIVSADEPFQRLFGIRTGASTITDLISPSIVGDLGQRLAALTPSAPETRIPEERGEWRVYGLFDDEGILSELEWSWQAPGGRSIETGVQQPTQNEESLIFREDKNGMIVSVDGTYRHMTGIVPEELQGTAILSIVSPAEREAISRARQAISSGQFLSVECACHLSLPASRGEALLFVVQISPVKDREEYPDGFLWIARPTGDRVSTRSGNMPSVGKARSARGEIRCLKALLQLLQDEETSEKVLLSGAATMICSGVPWIQGVSIQVEEGFTVSAGATEGEKAVFLLGRGAPAGEMVFHITRDAGEPTAQTDVLKAIAEGVSGYLSRNIANKAAKSQEKYYLTVFETTGTVSFMLEPSLRVVMANREFHRFFNLKPEDIQKGIEWTALVPEEERSRIRQYHELRRADPGSVPSTYECRVIAGDGMSRDVVVNVSLIPGTERSVISLLDITAKKETEFELRESEQRYRLIAENATDIIFTLGSDLTFTYVSPSFERLIGRPAAGVIAHPITEFISPQSSSVFSDAVQGILAPISPDESAASQVLEVEAIRADGESAWMEVQINALREENGSEVGLMGVMREISERKNAEEREIRYVSELSFLSSAAMSFVELPPEEEIYRFISEHLCEILDETLVFVADYDEVDDSFSLRAISGVDEDEHPRLYSLSRSIKGMRLALPEEVKVELKGGMLIPLSEGAVSSTLGSPAWSLARTFVGGGQVQYAAIGIARGETLFGCVVLVQKNEIQIEKISTIETFAHLSSVVLQRRRLETELESERSHLKHILSSSPVVIYASEAPSNGESGMGPITFVTDNITTLLGYEPQEVIYDSSFWTGRIHPSDRQRILEEEVSTLPDEGRLTLEYRIRHKDGKYRWLHSEVKLLRDEDGNPSEVIGSAIDISERKRIEEALRVMDSAITSSINAIIITDLEGDLVFANNSALRLWEYDDIKRVIGKPLDRFWLPKKKIARILEKIDQDGGWMGELVGKKKGGKRFNASVAASMVSDEENDPLCIMLSFVDITEKVEIEEELARYRGHLEELVIERTEKLTESNERLRAEVTERKRAEEEIRALSTFRESVIENTTMLLTVTDLDGNVTVWNRAAEEISGYGRDDVVGGDRVWNLLVPEDENGQHMISTILAELKTEGHVESFETRIRARNGDEKILQWGARILEDAAGQPIGAVHIAQDVTIRRRMERTIRESEARYRAVVEDQTEWICRFGPDLQLTFRNAAFSRSFGLKTSTRSPGSFRDILPAGFDDLLASLESSSLQSGQIVRIEGKVRRDGQKERWHQWSVRAIPASDGSIAEYQAIGRDVTEVKIAEEEFVRTEKLLSLSDLAGGIAHDFNNALTSIMGNLNLAKMKVAPDDFIYRRLSEAETATARAGEITKQLFSFSDRSTPEKETVDMADLIHEAVSYSLRGSKSRCRLDLEAAAMPVHVDAAQVLQVLQALIVNAEQAMPGGGVVTVAAAPFEVAGDDPIPLPAGTYVRVTVQDHGTGIRPEHLGRIFDPYFTTKEHGTGLGLAVALPIIKNHGGWLDVASTPGEGTNFFLYLPASAKDIDVKAKPEAVPSTGMGSILLMDDEAGILDTTSDILRYLGYTVTTAQDGEEAVRRFEEALEAGTHFDGVILDLTVPGKMGGLETLERLKERDSGIKVVVSSGYLNDPIIRKPEKYGFAASICKPYMVHELGRVLQEVLSI